MPLRASVTIDAPQGAVRRALLRTDTWTRTVRALDAYADIAGERAGPRAPLRTGDLFRIRRGRRAGFPLPTRSLILRVTIDSARLPSFDLLAGPVREFRMRLTIAEQGSRTLVTVDAWLRAATGPLNPLLRRRLRRALQLLFGILTLAAREQLGVVAGAVIDNGRVLAARRSSPPALAGKWELPGGKVDPGETDSAALTRELAEELGVSVTVAGRVGGDVDLGDNAVLRCYRAEIVAGQVRPLEHDEVRWVDASGLDTIDWLDPDREVLEDLRRLLSGFFR